MSLCGPFGATAAQMGGCRCGLSLVLGISQHHCLSAANAALVIPMLRSRGPRVDLPSYRLLCGRVTAAFAEQMAIRDALDDIDGLLVQARAAAALAALVAALGELLPEVANATCGCQIGACRRSRDHDYRVALRRPN